MGGWHEILGRFVLQLSTAYGRRHEYMSSVFIRPCIARRHFKVAIISRVFSHLPVEELQH